MKPEFNRCKSYFTDRSLAGLPLNLLKSYENLQRDVENAVIDLTIDDQNTDEFCMYEGYVMLSKSDSYYKSASYM